MTDAKPHEIRSFRPSGDVRPVRAASTAVLRVRWHTGLSQADFARAYGFDLEHLKALEGGRLEPDRALLAYLTVIDRAPEAVRSALGAC